MPWRAKPRFTLSSTVGLRAIRSSVPRQHPDELGNALIRIPRADIYRFGETRRPVLNKVDLTVRDGESWAIVGTGSSVDGKSALLQALLGDMRIAPSPPGGIFPALDPTRPAYEQIAHVAFSHRPRAGSGAFYDYTARYGAVREEDRVTLRNSMFADSTTLVPNDKFEEWIKKLGLDGLLDLPLVALSNGQTRRARIAQALLHNPAILILDEPLTGLDVQMRPALLELLRTVHNARNPRVIMGLRTQDPIPEWVSHVALVSNGQVYAGAKEEVMPSTTGHILSQASSATSKRKQIRSSTEPEQARETLVEMVDVNVKYHTRHVLKDINWTIRAGERWHLQGSNGSGKTTLCSMLTGDHPQSYTQHGLTLFGTPRRKHATPALRAKIGVVSPELNNAWPRARQMSVREAIGTGFDGGFVPMGKNGVGIGLGGALSPDEQTWRESRVEEVLVGLGPHCWSDYAQNDVNTWAERMFFSLSIGEQAVVLVMRSLVGAPPVLLLDEVWAGMDERMVGAVRFYLQHGGISQKQAVVVISHWESEVPWAAEDGLRRFMLEDGVGRELL